MFRFGRKVVATETTPQEVQERIQSGEQLLVFDVREPAEYQEGHGAGSQCYRSSVRAYNPAHTAARSASAAIGTIIGRLGSRKEAMGSFLGQVECAVCQCTQLYNMYLISL